MKKAIKHKHLYPNKILQSVVYSILLSGNYIPKFSYAFIDMLEILNHGFPDTVVFRLKKNVFP